MKELYDGALNA